MTRTAAGDPFASSTEPRNDTDGEPGCGGPGCGTNGPGHRNPSDPGPAHLWHRRPRPTTGLRDRWTSINSRPWPARSGGEGLRLDLVDSAWVIAPLSSRPLADAIWSAAFVAELAATDLMYSAWACCMARACSSWRSCMPFPRAIRYTSTPNHGMKITKSTHRVFATPPMSLLRKVSPKIQKGMSQAKNKKNSNIAKGTSHCR